ncbi:RNA-directed DNA polymerase (Reverse transcriptase), Ribonuclease H [Gossypium australe]|uniref:RNA-directed DNA polymerase (Reverse transcriptase), Ribonuclease H n=1 Tax=Gossypium australe TaxID=47621 RepID=A0A5B6WL19_9ROSI|nr:RNA-directed DNA polymerase (Reverse transcriptase), Ribonuclease H [Gossypium australe]
MIVKTRTDEEHIQSAKKESRSTLIKSKLYRSCLRHALKKKSETEKCDPIFCLLKKHNPGLWDEECQKTSDKVKHYLSNAQC